MQASVITFTIRKDLVQPGGACWKPAAGAARDRKLPSGEASNEAVAVIATALNDDEMQQIFGSDFDHNYAVVEVTLTPRGGKPFDVHPDDFLLRSGQTG